MFVRCFVAFCFGGARLPRPHTDVKNCPLEEAFGFPEVASMVAFPDVKPSFDVVFGLLAFG